MRSSKPCCSIYRSCDWPNTKEIVQSLKLVKVNFSLITCLCLMGRGSDDMWISFSSIPFALRNSYFNDYITNSFQFQVGSISSIFKIQFQICTQNFLTFVNESQSVRWNMMPKIFNSMPMFKSFHDKCKWRFGSLMIRERRIIRPCG